MFVKSFELSKTSPGMALRGAAGRDWGTNLARVKDYNEAVVLDHMRTGGPVTRAAIAAATGLTLQTVSNITGRLQAGGLVAAEAPAGRGQRFAVNSDAAFALGIHLVRQKVVAGVVDVAGTVRGSAEAGFALDAAPENVIGQLEGLVTDAVEQAGIARDRLLGAGIGSPGPLDLRAGALLNVLSPPSWSGFPMRDAVEQALGLRTILDNDSTAAAMGELWSGAAAGCDDFVYVYLGTGLGTGLVLGGHPYRGLRGNAGEISHLQIEPDGPPCDCGRRGCLGLYPTPSGLLREAERAILEAPPLQAITERPRTVEELAAAADPRLTAVVSAAGDRLGRVLTEMTRMLDPELIVLGGPLVPHVGERFRTAIGARLQGLGEPGAPPPRVELSRIGSDAGVVGAATLVLHDVYAPSSRKLSLAA
jgi:predicted NBD/HSP70 family sugar kinase